MKHTKSRSVTGGGLTDGSLGHSSWDDITTTITKIEQLDHDTIIDRLVDPQTRPKVSEALAVAAHGESEIDVETLVQDPGKYDSMLAWTETTEVVAQTRADLIPAEELRAVAVSDDTDPDIRRRTLRTLIVYLRACVDPDTVRELGIFEIWNSVEDGPERQLATSVLRHAAALCPDEFSEDFLESLVGEIETELSGVRDVSNLPHWIDDAVAVICLSSDMLGTSRSKRSESLIKIADEFDSAGRGFQTLADEFTQREPAETAATSDRSPSLEWTVTLPGRNVQNDTHELDRRVRRILGNPSRAREELVRDTTVLHCLTDRTVWKEIDESIDDRWLTHDVGSTVTASTPEDEPDTVLRDEIRSLPVVDLALALHYDEMAYLEFESDRSIKSDSEQCSYCNSIYIFADKYRNELDQDELEEMRQQLTAELRTQVFSTDLADFGMPNLAERVEEYVSHAVQHSVTVRDVQDVHPSVLYHETGDEIGLTRLLNDVQAGRFQHIVQSIFESYLEGELQDEGEREAPLDSNALRETLSEVLFEAAASVNKRAVQRGIDAAVCTVACAEPDGEGMNRLEAVLEKMEEDHSSDESRDESAADLLDGEIIFHDVIHGRWARSSKGSRQPLCYTWNALHESDELTSCKRLLQFVDNCHERIDPGSKPEVDSACEDVICYGVLDFLTFRSTEDASLDDLVETAEQQSFLMDSPIRSVLERKDAQILEFLKKADEDALSELAEIL